MKFFVCSNNRINTVYHEFQKGCFDGKTFWKDDSICLSDDQLFTLGVEKLFYRTIPDYSDTDEVEVTPKAWEAVKTKAQSLGGDIRECIAEADEWAQSAFSEYGVFTIIGV